jgi:hypothetical protein
MNINNSRIRTSTLFFLILFVCTFVKYQTGFCLPEIDPIKISTIKDNELLSIVGRNFGEHPDYDIDNSNLNFAFEKCENGIVEKSSKWTNGHASIVSNNNRIGSKYCLFHERTTTEKTYTNSFGNIVTRTTRHGLSANVTDSAPIHRYFYSMWIRFSSNFEGIQQYSDGTGAKFMMNTPFDEGGKKDYFSVGSSSELGEPAVWTNTENGCLNQKAGALNQLMPLGTWHRVDMYISVPDETTNYKDQVSFWIDGKHIRTTQQSGCHLQPNISDVHKVGPIGFVPYISNPNNYPFYINSDDHYLNFTQARVEISNSPIWNEEVQIHKELQMPNFWNDNKITIKLNIGSLNTSQKLYLYVVDENGLHNVDGILLETEASDRFDFRHEKENN